MTREKNKLKRSRKFKIRSGNPGSRKAFWTSPDLLKVLKVFLLVAVFASAGVLLYFAERYVKSTKPAATGRIELMNVPEWVGEKLKTKILEAAGQDVVKLDETAAQKVVENLSSIAWLDDVKGLTTDKSVQINAQYRKPIAVIESGSRKFYVDSKRVVLDYVPMPQLLIVEIKGLSLEKDIPHPGRVWRKDDLEAAVALREEIYKMDVKTSYPKPLLREISVIDVTNYDGRKNSREPHIIFYTKNNTAIIWGAELGKWSQNLESTDEQKLAKLFGYYKENGYKFPTSPKYIILRDPRDNITLPIDKY
jgi:hypothetical protein